MPGHEGLLDTLARADRLALAAHLRIPDQPVRDALVELRGHLRELAGAVAARRHRLRPGLTGLGLVALVAAAFAVPGPWFVLFPLAAVLGLTGWALRARSKPGVPDVDLTVRDVPVPATDDPRTLVTALAEAVTSVTAETLTWRVTPTKARAPAPLSVHADACTARIGALLDGEDVAVPPLEPDPQVAAGLRTALPWIHALVHEAHAEWSRDPTRGTRRLAHMDAAYRLVARHTPPAPTTTGTTVADLAGALAWTALPAAATVSPWPVAAGLAAVAAGLAYLAVLPVGPDDCPGAASFARGCDSGVLAVEAARKAEEVAETVAEPVSRELLRVRDLLRGRRRT
ncbi:hypothetical protein AB0I28_29055 [Phytomonospora sp. NPDC050363]|uniref:hypothetical protein n=1 Tax=Phytomonospora sp. NPDC050363 TaxID=3155642 RepID=UPI0033E22D53